MAKGRFKDAEFNLANSDGNIGTWERVAIAALYDIRDELKKLNSLLHCHNFTDIPFKLDAIRKNTTKKKRPRGKPKLRIVSGARS